MIRRRLIRLALASMLVAGLAVWSTSVVAAAGPPGKGVTCAYYTESANFPGPGTAGVTVGLKGRVCTNYTKVYTASGYPNSCYAAWPPIPGTFVSGVCGYWGNNTSKFHYRINFTIGNITGLLISLVLPRSLATIILPTGTKRDCYADWAYTTAYPGNYSHGALTGYCGPMYPYYN